MSGVIRSYLGLSVEEANRLMARRGLHPIGGGDGTDDDDDDEDDDDDDEDDSGKTGKTSSKKLYSEAELESVLKVRLGRERRRLTKALTGQIKDQVTKELGTADAVKKGDLQKVVDDLTPKAQAADKLKERVDFFEELANTRFEEALEGMPEALRALAPDEDADPLEKEKWLLVKAGPALAKLRKAGAFKDDDEDDDEDEDDDIIETARKKAAARKGNNPKMPKSGTKNSKRTVEDMMKEYKTAGEYRPLL